MKLTTVNHSRQTTEFQDIWLEDGENSSLMHYSVADGSFAPSKFASDCRRSAVPPMPLHDRDLKILTDLFTLDDIEAIEEDILSNLDRLLPEPCWEDDPFDFLREYL